MGHLGLVTTKPTKSRVQAVPKNDHHKRSKTMTLEYRIYDFQATKDWHLLDWIIQADPGQYTITPMPGWLTLIEIEVEQPGGHPLPLNLQHQYPQRRIVPARLDPYSGRLKDATISPRFYRVLPPGTPEPSHEEVQEHWRLLQAVQERQTL